MNNSNNNNTKIYLAAPFNHPNPKVREARVEAVNKKAAELMEQGYLVFSPLSHSYPISKYCTVDPCDNDFWLRQDLWILKTCDEFHILCLKGWWESKGIKAEMAYAKAIMRCGEIGLKVVLHEA